MCDHPICPLCEIKLKRCSGADDMPASQEFWQCHRCGLSAHISFLLTNEGREEIREQHICNLKRRVKKGRDARNQLRAAGVSSCNQSLPCLLLIGVGAFIGVIASRYTKHD